MVSKPNPPQRGYSFSDWQFLNPTKPLPGDQVDIEFDRLYQWTGGFTDWIGQVILDDGTINPDAAGDLIGPAGPPGGQGDVGATGPQGEQGIPGPVGPEGAQGPQGNPGEDGEDFRFDAIGVASARPLYDNELEGFTFLATDTQAWSARQTSTPGVWTPWISFGTQGDTGPQGPQGVPGPTGPAGPQGIQGPIGLTGAASTVPGPTGPQGPQGIQGPQGVQGDVGPQGPAGAGTGDVIGPAGATDNNPALFSGPTGKLLKQVTYAQFKTNLALTKSDVGLASVDNTSDASKPVSTAQAAAIALKADIASPTFTGDPKAPTPAPGDNDTSLATTAFVAAALASAAPATSIGDSPPGSPVVGQQWWESDTGKLFIYYNDGNTSQWVEAQASGVVPTAASIAFAPAGGIAAANVQAAITELEREGKSGGAVNMLINSIGQVNQRGTHLCADDEYGQDCWIVLSELGSINANPPFGSLRLTQNHASPQRYGCLQIVENLDAAQLRVRQVTLSGEFRTTDAGTLRHYAILQWDGTPDVVTSDIVNNWASTDYSVGNFFINPAGLTVLAVGHNTSVGASAFEEFTPITVTVGGSAQNLIVFFWTEPLATAKEFRLRAVQLEDGPVATFRSFRSYEEELRRCQRFYEKNPSYATGTWFAGWTEAAFANPCTVRFMAPKRATPTVVLTNLGNFNFPATPGTPVANILGFTEYRAGTAAAMGSFQSDWTASAEL